MLHWIKTIGLLFCCEFIVYFIPTQVVEQAACLCFTERKKHLFLHINVCVFLPVCAQLNQFGKNHLIFSLNQAYIHNAMLATESNNRVFSICTGWRSATGTEMLKLRSTSGLCLSESGLKCHFWSSSDESLLVSAAAARQQAGLLASMLLTLH